MCVGWNVGVALQLESTHVERQLCRAIRRRIVGFEIHAVCVSGDGEVQVDRADGIVDLCAVAKIKKRGGAIEDTTGFVERCQFAIRRYHRNAPLGRKDQLGVVADRVQIHDSIGANAHETGRRCAGRILARGEGPSHETVVEL